MTTAEWIAFGQMLTGMGGVGLVWLGLQQMRRAGDQREKREDARHREAMEALRQQGESLRVLIERTAPKEDLRQAGKGDAP